VTLADELRAMLDKAERYVASAEVLHAQGDYDFVLTVSEDDVIDLSSKAQQFITATSDFLKTQGRL
jgi:uncharacterized protein (UPF0332 family)